MSFSYSIVLLYTGVDNDKWYEECDSAQSAGKIARANDTMDYEEREKVFTENRKELMKQCRLLKLESRNVFQFNFVTETQRNQWGMFAEVCSWILDIWRTCSSTSL